MKALLRNYDGQYYVWKTVKFDNGRFQADGMTLCEQDIVSIVNDNRKNYVACSSCGRVFSKGTDKFEIHKQESETITPCLSCSQLGVYDRVTYKRKFEMNEDGTFKEKTEGAVVLKCNNCGHWNRPLITSDEAKQRCLKRQCGNARAVEIEDTFTKYPGLFDEIITSDRIDEVGYKDKMDWDGSYTYTLNGRNKIEANVNMYGIVDGFTVYYEDDYWTVYYSKKYDKFFTVNCGGYYTEFDPPYLGEKTRKYIENKIAALYK